MGTPVRTGLGMTSFKSALNNLSLRGSVATAAIRTLRGCGMQGKRIPTTSLRTGLGMTSFRLHLNLVIARERSDRGNPSLFVGMRIATASVRTGFAMTNFRLH